jgi:hypothetical protein
VVCTVRKLYNAILIYYTEKSARSMMEKAISVSSKQEDKELTRAYSTYLNVTSPG